MIFTPQKAIGYPLIWIGILTLLYLIGQLFS